MSEKLRQFSFVDHGRTFVCEVAASRVLGPDPWWWFEVSTEKHQRHAPFRAEPTDTEEGVQLRMVAYYDFLLERRAAPVVKKWSRPQPEKTAAVAIENDPEIEAELETALEAAEAEDAEQADGEDAMVDESSKAEA